MKLQQPNFVNIVNVKKQQCPTCSFDITNNSMNFDFNQNPLEQKVRCPICNEKWLIEKDAVFEIADGGEKAFSIGNDFK